MIISRLGQRKPQNIIETLSEFPPVDLKIQNRRKLSTFVISFHCLNYLFCLT